MKQKEFKLEQVLNFRREVEKVCTRDFASAKDDFEMACQRLEEDEIKMDDLSKEVQELQREGMTAQELQLYADYLQRMNVDIKLQRLEAESLNTIMLEKREALIEASIEKKVLETLKEKQAEEFVRELSDKERLFLEEVALRKKTL